MSYKSFNLNYQKTPNISKNVLDDNNIAIPPIIHKTALPINHIFIKLYVSESS